MSAWWTFHVYSPYPYHCPSFLFLNLLHIFIASHPPIIPPSVHPCSFTIHMHAIQYASLCLYVPFFVSPYLSHCLFQSLCFVRFLRCSLRFRSSFLSNSFLFSLFPFIASNVYTISCISSAKAAHCVTRTGIK